MKILFHGNFESAADWSFLGSEWRVFPLWDFLRDNPAANWEEFSALLIKKLRQDFSADPTELAGYSLGGRILLNLVAQNYTAPRMFFLSTHPGLADTEERYARVWRDLQWKETVLHEPWADVIAQWNAQAVFGEDGARELIAGSAKAALEAARPEIAHAFDLLSLGRMANFSEPSFRFPAASTVSWICGKLDDKFLRFGEALCSEKGLKLITISDAGHRVHKARPEAIAELLNSR